MAVRLKNKILSRFKNKKSLDFRIWEMMIAYPSLFPTRFYAIHHLYLVLGNGYEWQDGRLVERVPDEKRKAIERMLKDGKTEGEMRKAIQKMDDQLYGEMRAETRRVSEKLQALSKKYKVDLADPVDHPKSFQVYPVCDLSEIMNIPDDVRPDWLAGAEEALAIMELYPTHDEKERPEHRKFIPVIRKRIEFLKASL